MRGLGAASRTSHASPATSAIRRQREGDSVRNAELLDPVRERVARLPLGVARERAERAQPVEARNARSRADTRNTSDDSEAAMVDPPAGGARFDGTQGEEEHGDPLEQNRRRPTPAPARLRGRAPARASAPRTSATMSASLWPPPAKWIAKSGFQPTSAAACRAGHARASRPAATHASTASAAIVLKIQAAAAADEPGDDRDELRRAVVKAARRPRSSRAMPRRRTRRTGRR